MSFKEGLSAAPNATDADGFERLKTLVVEALTEHVETGLMVPRDVALAAKNLADDVEEVVAAAEKGVVHPKLHSLMTAEQRAVWPLDKITQGKATLVRSTDGVLKIMVEH